MKYYSTKNFNLRVSAGEAIMKGLPSDNGLFMPLEIPKVSPAFLEQIESYTLSEIGLEVSIPYLLEDIPLRDLRGIVERSLNFPAPVRMLEARTGVLELFHGPSLAFKDFGARFMAETMSWFNRHEDRRLTILVATSGDTGGAVAAGFLGVPGIDVVILYPSGKVSPLQEKQLTALGQNITALEIDGTFDDCQALVKQAFLDESVNAERRLSSANSINIARLIPQMFYYFEAWKQVKSNSDQVVFVTPSGNFGNLTAGLMAQRMGLPATHFIAATNSNDVVPAYLHSGEYHPRPSTPTLSNAMDVGAPSNFARMMDLFCSTWNIARSAISGYAFDDAQTESAMREIDRQFGYVMDPHGAVGYLALEAYRKETLDSRALGVVLETAHPAKFLEDVQRILGREIVIPPSLADLAEKNKVSIPLSKDYAPFRQWLMDTR